ncbi:MAG TPA: hypothetical protein VEY93_09290 [Longimicrobium sp.]|nr:hypothetical protein [Longimicrobium sp.]
MKGQHSDLTTQFHVLAKGQRVEHEFAGSLHMMFDEAQRAGIALPHGLWYIGPLGRGLFRPVDESVLEAVYDPSLITPAQIRDFLMQLGIEVQGVARNA